MSFIVQSTLKISHNFGFFYRTRIRWPGTVCKPLVFVVYRKENSVVWSTVSSVSDYWRLCTISFKVKFGSNFWKQFILLQKIFSGHQNEKGCFVVVSAEICKEVRLPVVQDSMRYSDQVSNPCGRKNHNLGQLYQFIKAAVASTTSTYRG